METAISVLSWMGAVLTSVVLIPQSYKIIKTRDTQALSLYMYIIFEFSAVVWIIFAILAHQPAIIATNTIVAVLATIILILKIINIIKKDEKP